MKSCKKNPAYRRQSISRPLRIVAPIQKKTLLVRQNSPKHNFFCAPIFTLYEQKISNLRPLLSITFPQRFKKSKKLGHWTLRNGSKKTFKWSEQKKTIHKKKILPQRFYTLYEQKFSNLRPLLFVTFPQGFRKSNKFVYWTSGSSDKKTVKQSEKHR